MGWFYEVSVDREHMAVGNTAIPRRLRASEITPYYTLICADEVMTEQEFFAAIRAIDRAWFEALAQKQAAAAKPPKKAPAKHTHP